MTPQMHYCLVLKIILSAKFGIYVKSIEIARQRVLKLRRQCLGVTGMANLLSLGYMMTFLPWFRDDRWLGLLVDHFKMALDCFFAVWFVVGNVWIFGGHSSSSDAPNLYRLCLVFLTFSCIGYAMPFILCAMICCCLPCIIPILGAREDLNGMRGATEESINALPKHKFKIKRNQSGNNIDSGSGFEDGGYLAAGTEKERAISGEDAVCCICLTKYEDDDELRELPCSHFFHTECVDKWLKINASCPLCKFEIGGGSEDSPPAESNQQG